MKELEPLKIYKVINLKNIVLLPLGLIIIAFFFFYAYVSENPIALIAVIGGLFGGYFFILIRKLNTKQDKPVLIISQEGIKYKSTGLIYWDYITQVKLKFEIFNRYEKNKLIIFLKDQQKLIIVTDNLDHTSEAILEKIALYRSQLP